jgi:hypothetical protein
VTINQLLVATLSGVAFVDQPGRHGPFLPLT